jgi:hypothetical protein
LASSAENTADKVRKNRQARGERINGKLSDEDVMRILQDRRPCFVIGREYGVSDTAVSLIKLGKTWKHINRPAGYTYTPYRARWDHTPYEENNPPPVKQF